MHAHDSALPDKADKAEVTGPKPHAEQAGRQRTGQPSGRGGNGLDVRSVQRLQRGAGNAAV
ncbi:MAG: hypothetical protein HOV68_15520, partial [Streptomycetaceae bacterium]|nr:hypothetical protein [Streptomycetaceae bacterium]